MSFLTTPSIIQNRIFKFQRVLNFILVTGIIVCLFLSFTSLEAATQGTEGNTSTGTIETVVVIGRFIRIGGLRDFNFGTWNAGDGTLSDNDNVCIGKNDFFGPYAIRAAGNGDLFDPAAFTLSNGVDQVYYNVYWNDSVGTAGNQQLTAGLILHGQTGSFLSFLFNLFGFCFSNANVEIEIPDTELSAASGGAYSGTLTLLVIPD